MPDISLLGKSEGVKGSREWHAVKKLGGGALFRWETPYKGRVGNRLLTW